MNDLRDIVRDKGGDVYAGGKAAVIPGPGHSRSDRSLSLRLDEAGNIRFHSFAGDSVRDCFNYLGIEAGKVHAADRWELERMRRLRDEERRRQQAEDQAFCAGVWRETLPFEASLAEAYLWSRGLMLEDCPDIRFHPAAPRGKPRRGGDERPLPAPHPAMVAVVRNRDGAPLGLHLTYVAIHGNGKAFGDRSRLMFGSVRGGTVHLTPPGPTMGLGEGIETCLAYRALKGLPIWAALTTSQYATFELPRRVRNLVIAADGDKGGMNAAQSLGERMQRVCDVQIDPAPSGEDWADVFKRESAHV